MESSLGEALKGMSESQRGYLTFLCLLQTLNYCCTNQYFTLTVDQVIMYKTALWNSFSVFQHVLLPCIVLGLHCTSLLFYL